MSSMPEPRGSVSTAAQQLAHPWGFHVDTRVERDQEIVTPRGELDLATVPRLEIELVRARSSGRAIVLDLRQLTFMDSSGLHLLMRVDADVRSRGQSFAIIDADGPIARLLTIVGLRDRLRHAEPGAVEPC